MKIVIASDIYYPMTNGVAVFAHNLANGLAARGHEVMVICPSFKGYAYKRRDRKTKVLNVYTKSVRCPFYPDQINKVADQKEILGYPLPRLVYKNGIWASINPYSEIKKVLNKFQPDVIHLQTAEGIAIAVRWYAKRHGVPMVATGHAYPDNVTGQLKLLKPVKKPLDVALRTYMNSFLKHSEYATMPTEMAIDNLIPKNRKRFKVTVEPLSNGVDLSQFSPGKPDDKIVKKYNIAVKQPRVIYVGRVDPEKSIGTVIMAFAKVLGTNPKAELLIVGDGTDKARLEKIVNEYDLNDNIRFLGKVMPPDLQEVYRTADVFATASETETQGIVLIEAAATGLPLVAVDAGAVKELCQNKRNGILCQPGDVDGLANGMKKLLADEKVRKKYGEESLKIAEKHDLNNTLARFEEIYKKAIELHAESLDEYSDEDYDL